MTINAYNKIYLDDAMQTLGAMMDCAVNILGCPAQEFSSRFLSSGIADRFSRGNEIHQMQKAAPSEISGAAFRSRFCEFCGLS